jgi:hypothetical protein
MNYELPAWINQHILILTFIEVLIAVGVGGFYR